MIIDHYISKKKGIDVSIGNEKHYRSFVKALSWRALGTIDTILISWIITGKTTLAFTIGGFELLTKTFLYYFHERLWNLIKWGTSNRKNVNDGCKSNK